MDNFIHKLPMPARRSPARIIGIAGPGQCLQPLHIAVSRMLSTPKYPPFRRESLGCGRPNRVLIVRAASRYSGLASSEAPLILRSSHVLSFAVLGYTLYGQLLIQADLANLLMRRISFCHTRAFVMRTAKRLADAREVQIPTRLAGIVTGLPRTAPWPVLFAISLAFFTILTIVIESTAGIFFETNDDVGMMMIAHGFGVAALPSSAILFSNVLEGKIIEFIGEPFGFTGYGIYTMSCLVIALAYIHATIGQLTQRYFASLILILGLGLRAVFAPQFTITAGILAVAAIIALIVCLHRRSTWQSIAFATFAVASFCMRDQMFYLVMIMAVPFLLKWHLKLDWPLLGMLAGVIILCVLLTVLDDRVYRSPPWQAFESMNAIRALFTDFGLAGRIHADATLASVGLTPLDIQLVSRWWFIGISPERLYHLVSLLAPTSMFSLSMSQIVGWLNLYTNAPTYMISILTMVTFFAMPIRRTPRSVISLVILLSATLIIVAAGRNGVSRIVYPCLCLLCLANFLFCTRCKLLLYATILTLPLTLNHFIERDKYLLEVHDVATADLGALAPAAVHVVWGADFPYEALFRPLEVRQEMPKLRLFGLGVAQLAPFALAYWNGSQKGFIAQLTSPAGLSVFASISEINLLGSFCDQKFHGRLSVQDVVITRYFRHQRVSCQVASVRQETNGRRTSEPSGVVDR
jgi:hypothetical protein